MRFTILPYRRFSAAANMAVDAGMMSLAQTREAVCFRYYGWAEAAITFGYSQPAAMARNGSPEHPVAYVRRETGGGVVDHRGDLTYALAVPRAHPAWGQPPGEFYRAVHGALSRSFQEWGVGASLAPCACDDPQPARVAPHCFMHAEPGDVIESAGGRKLAGAALRRHSSALLLQGSISRVDTLSMLDDPVWRRRFPFLLSDALGCAPPLLAENWPDDLPAPTTVRRFASPAWNARR